MAITDQLPTFFGGIGVGGLIAGVIYAVKWLLENPAFVDRTQSTIFRYLKGFNDRYDRNFVKSNVQAAINEYSAEDLGFEIGKQVKIAWQKRSSKQRFLDENEVVVHLQESENQSTNIARATEQYVKKSVLAEQRRYIDPEISDAMALSS